MKRNIEIALSVVAGVAMLGFVVIFIGQMWYDWTNADETASGPTHPSQTASNSPSSPAATSASNADSAVVNAIDTHASDMVAVQHAASGHCSALTPAGWTINDQVGNGAGVSFAAPDGSGTALYLSGGYAQYSVDSLNTALRPFGYLNPGAQLRANGVDNRYSSPLDYVTTTLKQMFGAGVQVDATAQAVAGGYSVVNYTTADQHGFAMFRSFQGQPPNVAVVMRIASAGTAGDPRALAIAGSVATSIRCDQQLAPPPMPASEAASVPSGSPSEGNSSPTCQVWSPNCNDSDFAGTYNAQIGTGYVHDDAGNNYLMDPDKDRIENGPDGPGYYKHVGDNLIKLDPGWTDN